MNRLALLLLPLLAAAAGCTHFEPVQARRDHTAGFTRQLEERAAADLAQPLTLDACLALAMRHNYGVRQADLRLELNRIGRNVAFTAFLPTVAASAGYKSYAKDPGITQREFGEASLDIGLPLFMPSTWYLFAAQRQRVAIAETASFYIRQGIVLQTSTAFYTILIAQDTVTALESQLKAARETAARVGALAGEGLVAQWEGDRAVYMAEAREVELAQARRQLEVQRGELLVTLGLPPSAPLRLAGPPPRAAPPPGSTADRVLKALEIHPELAMADRQVVVSQQEVRQAFTDFLPTLTLSSTRTWTGDDLARHSANWRSGLTAVWPLFNGFANVARYRAAKVLRASAQLAREAAFLTVMLQVVSADAALSSALEHEHLRAAAFRVAEAKAADYDAQAREGLIPMIDALDALAERDFAQLVLVRSRYQADIARAGLDLAMGATLVPIIESDNGSPK